MSRLLIILMVAVLASGCAGVSPEAFTPTASPTSVPATSTPTGTAQPNPTETPAPPAEPAPAPQGFIAYIAPDGNLWLVARASGDRLQITSDAAPLRAGADQNATVISYREPRWSSDGRLLAFVQEVGTPVTGGFQFQYGLWLYDLAMGTSRALLQDQHVIGYGWQPGTHLLAFGQPTDMAYFNRRGSEPATEFARGILAVDADGGEPFTLVAPERGYSLIQPAWSPDGRRLAFEEVQYMEGRGLFAFYDLDAQQYIAWDRVIGAYSWMPDGTQIAYDQIGYIAQGNERIWISDLQGGNERAISPEYSGGYAFQPVFSPQGEQVAYLAELEGPESGKMDVMVLPVNGGEPRDLGTYEQVIGLAWSPDGNHLYFRSGEFDQPRVMEIEVASGSASELVAGEQPAWQPRVVEAAPLTPESGAGEAVFSTALPSDRPGINLLVAYDPGWAEQEYVAFTEASVPLDGPVAAERGLADGLVQLVSPDGGLQSVPAFRLTPDQVDGRIRVQYDQEKPEWADLVYTPQDLVLVYTFTDDAGLFTVSRVYHLPRQGSVDDYRRGLLGDEHLLYLLGQGTAYYQMMSAP